MQLPLIIRLQRSAGIIESLLKLLVAYGRAEFDGVALDHAVRCYLIVTPHEKSQRRRTFRFWRQLEVYE